MAGRVGGYTGGSGQARAPLPIHSDEVSSGDNSARVEWLT